MASTKIRAGLAIVAASALVLTGCTNGEKKAEETTTATSTSTATSTATSTSTSTTTSTAKAVKLTSENVTLTDAFAKAAVKEDGHTAVFGVLNNTTDEDLNIVSFTSTVDAGSHELHEVVNGTMQEIKGGFVLDAGKEFVMKPGSYHMMIMKLGEDVKAGDKIDITVEFKDGQKIEYKDIPVRDIASGAENYGGNTKDGHEGHDMKDGHEGHDMKEGDKK